MTGLEVLPFPRAYPGKTGITRLSCLSSARPRVSWQSLPEHPERGLAALPRAAAACAGGPAVQSPLLPWSSRASGGVGEPSLWTQESGVCEVLQKAGDEVAGLMLLPSSSVGRAGDQLRADLTLLHGGYLQMTINCCHLGRCSDRDTGQRPASLPLPLPLSPLPPPLPF